MGRTSAPGNSPTHRRGAVGRERIDVDSIGAVGRRLFKAQFGSLPIAPESVVAEALVHGSAIAGPHHHSLRFLHAEWDQLVEPWQLTTWEAYRDAPRIGRKTRLLEKQRATIWTAFSHVWDRLAEQSLVTPAGAFYRLSERLRSAGRRPYDFVLVDESQDFGPAHLHFLASLGANGVRPASDFLEDLAVGW